MDSIEEAIKEIYKTTSLKFEYNGIHCAIHKKLFNAELYVNLDQAEDTEKRIGKYIGFDFEYDINKHFLPNTNIQIQKKPNFGLVFVNEVKPIEINLTLVRKEVEYKTNTLYKGCVFKRSQCLNPARSIFDNCEGVDGLE